MLTLILIGLVGGLITGISPCILPVLPVVFFASGVPMTQTPVKAPATVGGGATPAPVDEMEIGRERRTANWRPYKVIAGLVLSFTVFTLLGSLLINALGLPNGILRYIGLAVLVLVGLGLIFPRLEALLEAPFTKIPTRQFGADRGAFTLGLGLGLLYVPCAGPVLAAITVASATGNIGPKTIALTASFAVGAGAPLLLFALAGARAAERIKAFRTRARTVRVVAGVVMIALAAALVFNLPAIVQRALPDYTGGLQKSIGNSNALNNQLTPNQDASNAQLVNCPSGSSVLHQCGPAPALKATSWLNTPGNAPIDLASLKGGVTIVDFWTYSCINCQRDVPHVEAWSKDYQASGLHVIGVHAPEFVFERDVDNIKAGARSLGVTYPIAVDNNLSTWTAYRNQYWPALYLIDATGTVRSIHFGEGDYQQTEALIRQLLTAANPHVALPKPTDLPATALTADRTPETYLSYVGLAPHTVGDPLVHGKAVAYTLPSTVPDDRIGLGGTWTAGDEYSTTGAEATLAFNYKAKDAHAVLSGTGTVTVTDGSTTKTVAISGTPRLYDLTSTAQATRSTLTLTLTPGLQVYSFTFG